MIEFTSRQLKDAIRTGSDEVYGLKLDEETGEIVVASLEKEKAEERRINLRGIP